MPQRDRFQQDIQDRKHKHETRTDNPDRPYAAKQSLADIVVRRIEQLRSVFVPAEDRFQLWPQLRQQDRVFKSHHRLSRHVGRKARF